MEALAIRDDGWPRRSGAACHLASVSGEQFYDRGRGAIAQDDLGRLGQVLAPQLLGFLSAALADELDEPGVGAQRDLRELLLMLPVMAVRPARPAARRWLPRLPGCGTPPAAWAARRRILHQHALRGQLVALLQLAEHDLTAQVCSHHLAGLRHPDCRDSRDRVQAFPRADQPDPISIDFSPP